ncbi:MAG: hypothetical protein LUH63_03755 [Parabacteroides sp.]|nr:hypothetical protein [Parabacteroides sp.]
MCKLPDNNEGFTVICDISYNNDYSYKGFNQPDSEEECSALPKEFNAPTLAKRYKFHIRPAEESLIQAGEPFERYTIYAPKTGNDDGINIQLARPLDNYYWTGDEGVTHISFEHNWNKKTPVSKDTLDAKRIEIVSNPQVENITLNNSYQVFTLEFPDNTIKETTTVKIKHTEDNIIFAEYTIIPVDNAGFTAEVEILDESVETQPYHEPEKHPELYEEIGVVDFDSFDGMEKEMEVIEKDEKFSGDAFRKNKCISNPVRHSSYIVFFCLSEFGS